MVHASSVTPTSAVVSVLSDSTESHAYISSLVPCFAEPSCLVMLVPLIYGIKLVVILSAREHEDVIVNLIA